MSHSSKAKSIIPIFDDLEAALNIPESTQKVINNLDIIEAKADHAKFLQFLLQYSGSKDTFNSYRREIERFTQWLWFVAGKSIKELRGNDIEEFLNFCIKPPKEWIGLNVVSRFIDENGFRVPNPTWKPFVIKMSKKENKLGKTLSIHDHYIYSQAAIKSTFAVINSFYNYLIDDRYTEINPVAQIRQKSKFIRKQQSKTQMIRRLTEIQWQSVIDAAKKMAAEAPETHARTLFIMSALYLMYLRISELAASKRWAPQMGHFFRDHNGLWWFKTVGKGNKERNISVSDSMLEALKNYRLHLDLPALPSLGEKTPLLAKSRGKTAISNTRQIRRIVQQCFDEAVNALRKRNLDEEADQLMSATVHWLRHTGISDDVKRRPREHVRDDAGHGSSAITDKYIDIELRERHKSVRNKPITPETNTK
jgi:site-specific recombinase XerD